MALNELISSRLYHLIMKSIQNQFLCIPKEIPISCLQFPTISFVSVLSFPHFLHLFISLHPACTTHLFSASSSLLFLVALFPVTSPPSLDLVYRADPFVSFLGFRPITSGCGSMERLRPRPIAGWSWRNPLRSSWTSLAMSHCSSSESCSTCQVFHGWSKKQPGKEEWSKTTSTMSDTHMLLHAVTLYLSITATFYASASSFSLL